ncbi:MAG: ATP:cob(I)alamin adenosyltransferase, partial [Phycisphaerae bacterium]|nr:ATP:cob(I)alamin adenosyltransferase [Phycisphaerae bacterium]
GQVEDLAVESSATHTTANLPLRSRLTVPPAPLDDAVARMEKCIDAICGELSELKDFILPGGCELACRLHLARTIARRTERAVVAALNPTDDGQCSAPVVLRYLNRLSDLLFALARLANHNAGEAESTPKP